MSDQADEFQLSSTQREDAHRSFKLFDKKGQNKMGIKDLGNLFKGLAMSITSEKLEQLMDSIDDEGTGEIDFEQFIAIYTKKKKEDENEKELKEAFKILDKQGQGVIPVEDLRWIMRALGDDITEEEIDDMITMTDVDGSGTVDYDEFKALMNG